MYTGGSTSSALDETTKSYVAGRRGASGEGGGRTVREGMLSAPPRLRRSGGGAEAKQVQPDRVG